MGGVSLGVVDTRREGESRPVVEACRESKLVALEQGGQTRRDVNPAGRSNHEDWGSVFRMDLLRARDEGTNQSCFGQHARFVYLYPMLSNHYRRLTLDGARDRLIAYISYSKSKPGVLGPFR